MINKKVQKFENLQMFKSRNHRTESSSSLLKQQSSCHLAITTSDRVPQQIILFPGSGAVRQGPIFIQVDTPQKSFSQKKQKFARSSPSSDQPHSSPPSRQPSACAGWSQFKERKISIWMQSIIPTSEIFDSRVDHSPKRLLFWSIPASVCITSSTLPPRFSVWNTQRQLPHPYIVRYSTSDWKRISALFISLFSETSTSKMFRNGF